MEKQLSEGLTLYKGSRMNKRVKIQLRVSVSSDLGYLETRRMGPKHRAKGVDWLRTQDSQ